MKYFDFKSQDWIHCLTCQNKDIFVTDSGLLPVSTEIQNLDLI